MSSSFPRYITSCTSCNNAIFVGWASPTIDRGLFLRWWAVPTRKRRMVQDIRYQVLPGNE